MNGVYGVRSQCLLDLRLKIRSGRPNHYRTPRWTYASQQLLFTVLPSADLSQNCPSPFAHHVNLIKIIDGSPTCYNRITSSDH